MRGLLLSLSVVAVTGGSSGGVSFSTPDVPPLVRGIVGGAAYGLVAAAISHPFDTIKTRRQIDLRLAQTGSRQLLHSLAGLYRGVGPATAASVLFRTVPFIGYEATRNALRARKLLEDAPLVAAFVSGVAGGVMRGCLETPAELIKTRLQVQSSWRLSQLLRGLSSTCLRNGCVIGLYWVFFEASKPAREACLPPILSNFAAGGGCSVLAWAAIYPLDTAKSCIQAQDGRAPGVVTQLARIYRSAGISGWYAGMGAGLLRAFLANGGGMAMYGLVQVYLTSLASPTTAGSAMGSAAAPATHPPSDGGSSLVRDL